MSKPEQSPSDRYYTAWAIVGELIACILTSAAAKLIGKRIGHIAEGSWLPGMADVRTLAGFTNRSPRTIEDSATKDPRQKYRAGRTVLYRLADFAIPAKMGEPEDE